MEAKSDDFCMKSATNYLIVFLVFGLILVIFMIIVITGTNDAERSNTSYKTKLTSFSSDGNNLRMPRTCFFLDQRDTNVMGIYNGFLINDLSNNNVNNLWEFEQDPDRQNVFSIKSKVPANNGVYLAYEGTNLFFTRDRNKNIYWKVFWTGVSRQFKIRTISRGNFLGRNESTSQAQLSPQVFKWRVVPTRITRVKEIKPRTIYTITFFSSDLPLVLALAFPQEGTQGIRIFTCGFDFNQIGKFVFAQVPGKTYYRIFMNINDQRFTMVAINKGNGKFPVTLVPFPNDLEEKENQPFGEHLLFWDMDFQSGLYKMEPRPRNLELGVQYVLGLNDNVELPSPNCHLIVKDISTFNPSRDFVLLSLR